jgi:hypothetical protein
VAPITFYKPQSADSDFFKTKRNELENAPPLPSRKKQCEEIFSEIKSRVPPSHKTGVLGIGIRGELKCGKRDPESRIGIRFLSDACLKCDAGKNAGISLSSGGAHKWTLTILAHPAGSISVEYCNLTPSNASFTSSRSSYGSGDKILFCELPSAKDEHREKDLAYVTDVPSLEQTDIRWLLEEIGVVGGNSAYLRAKVPSTGDDEIANRFKSSFLHFDEEAESTIYELAKDHPDFAVDICEEVVDYCGKNQLLYVSGENANSALEVSEKWREVARNKIRGPSGKKAQQLSKDADVKRFQDAREAMAREIAKLFEMSSRPVPLRQIEVKTLDLDQDPYDVICDLVEDKIILEKGTGYIFSNRLYLTVAKPPDQS